MIGKRGPPGGRILELLDSLRAEYDMLTRNANSYKMERDDYDRKLQQALQESQSIQNQISELERSQQFILRYEEEILHLRRQLGQTDTSAPRPQISEKRPITAIEVGAAQDLGNLNKAHRDISHRMANSPSGNTSNNAPQAMNTTKSVPNPSKRTSSEASNNKPVQSAKKRKPNSPDTDTDDWVVGYNPSVPRRLDVKLDHDIEHDSVVCCVSFTTDGKYMATGCNISAHIYDVKSGNKVHTFREKQESDNDLYIRSVCFSPDGKYLATGAEDRTVKLWEIEKETVRHNLIGHELDIYSLAFTPDGKHVVSGSGDKRVRVWRVDDAKCVWTLGDDQNGPKDGVTSVAVSPDGQIVASGSLDRMVRLWEVETGQLIGQYEGHKDSVYSVAFSPDGKTLASGSLDKTLKLWDVNRQSNLSKCRITLNGHRDFVLSVAFSPDGNWLVSGSKDRSVQFWDPRTSITHMILQGHRNSVISVALSGEKDGTYGKFATGSGDWRARIWSYKNGNFAPIQQITNQPS